ALGALVQTDVHCRDFVEEVGSAFHEQIRQAWGRTGVDQCRAILLLEFLYIAELLGSKGMAGKVGTQVHIMRAQPQRRAQDNLIEDLSRSIDDELAALRGLHDSAQISRVHLGYRDGAFLAQEAPRALRIAVAAPDRMSLPLQQLCEKGAGRSGPQNEDPHGVAKTLSQSERPLRLAFGVAPIAPLGPEAYTMAVTPTPEAYRRDNPRLQG